MTGRKPSKQDARQETEAESDIVAIAAAAGLEKAAALFPGDVAVAYRNAMASRAGIVRELPPELAPFEAKRPG